MGREAESRESKRREHSKLLREEQVQRPGTKRNNSMI